MRLSLGWLAEWIELPALPELEERLNLGGFEDAVVEQVGSDLSGGRVGQVLERAGHPHAERLAGCRWDLGEGETRGGVCGAPSVAAGQGACAARDIPAHHTASHGADDGDGRTRISDHVSSHPDFETVR